MTKLQIALEHKFLTDKQWWVEETEKEYILFIKHKGRFYKSYLEKTSLEFAEKIIKGYHFLKDSKEAERDFLLFELKNMVNQLELRIMESELEELKK